MPMLSSRRIGIALGALFILGDVLSGPRDARATDWTQGTTCGATPQQAAGPISGSTNGASLVIPGGGNNLVCESGTWQYPPYVFGDDPNSSDGATTCTQAGEMRWNATNAYLQYCSGSLWNIVGQGATIYLGSSATATNPHVSGDAGTGLFTPIGSTLAIATGGSERMRVSSGGYVGIGTTAPTEPLDLYAASGNSQALIQTAATATADIKYINSGASWEAGLYAFGDGGFNIGTNTPALSIQSSGNVGIGTTSPQSLLSILGTTTTGQDLLGLYNYHDNRVVDFNQDQNGNPYFVLFQNGYAWPSAQVALSGYYSSVINPVSYATDGGLEIGGGAVDQNNGGFGIAVVTSSANGAAYFNGRVGIGSTIPRTSLDLSQETDAILLPIGTTGQRSASPVNGMLRYNSSTPGFEGYVTGTGWEPLGGSSSVNLGTSTSAANPQISGDATSGLYTPASSTVAIVTGGTERLRVTAAGYVGIGTTNPVSSLDLSGNSDGLKLQTTSASAGQSCTSTQQGEIRFNSNTSVNNIEFCDGSNWRFLAAGTTSCGTPSGLSFTNVTGAALSTVTTSGSATITFSGCSSALSVSVTGAASAQISVNGGAWVTSGSINSGQTLQVRLTSSGSVSTGLTATVTVGSSSTNWTVTTRGGSLAIFETSGLYIGTALGGLSGADAICQSEANAAGYSVTFKAVMSDDSTSASSRLTLSYPIVNAYDGTTVSSSNLFNGTLTNPIRQPNGGYNRFIWTGTNPDGTIATSLTCGSWTASGSSGAVGCPDLYNSAGYFNCTTLACSSGQYLNCVQQ